MRKVFGICLTLFFALLGKAQEASLPEDLRQHNLTQLNAGLLNPTFSYDWNRPHAGALWNRWQWQTIDGDPTSVFLSYTHKLNPNSTIGGGFLQHNTGTFLNTGGLVNFSQVFDFASGIKLVAGANLLAFQQELSDDRFIPDDGIDLPQLREANDFFMQVTPGVRLIVDGFSVALGLENAINLNLSNSDYEGPGSAFVGVLSNDFPVVVSDGLGKSFIRPIVYVKTLPQSDTQFGLNTLFSTSKFWVQGGYNNFYGPSAGAGVTLFNRVSVGGLMEFSTGEELQGEDSTIELLLSYHFGKQDNRRKVVGFDIDEDDKLAEKRLQEEREKEALARQEELAAQEREQQRLEEQEENRLARERDSINQAISIAERKRVQDSIAQAREQEAKALREQQRLDSISQIRDREAEVALEQRRLDSIAEQRRKQAEAVIEQQRLDSIANERRKQAEALQEQQRADSIAKLQNQEDVDVKPGEKYEEVVTAEGLEPGFYLIANVFGTKKYFDNFMKTLQDRGLNPKSFFRKLNGFNYVYLERYNTIEEARKARDSKFFGKYPDKTWVFRVRQ